MKRAFVLKSQLLLLFPCVTLQVSRRQTNLSTMMLSALNGAGLTELQRELASLDPSPVDGGSTPRDDHAGGVEIERDPTCDAGR